MDERYFIVPLIVPVFFGKICFPVLDERYFLHNPKSIIYITFGSFIPIKKFSGFMSLYIILLECIHSNLSNIWFPIKHISIILHKIALDINISFKDFPNNVSIKIL